MLTIVVPTLNSARTLGDTLNSLRSASARLIRLVVADSASTDGTLDICRQYNVDVVQVPKGNMYRAINAGLSTATTPWMGYVNSDDYVFPGAYLSMLEWGLTREATVVYGRGDYVNPDGAFLHSLTPPVGATAVAVLRCGIMPFIQPAAIFRAENWRTAGGFSENYRHVADFEFFCRLAVSGCRFEYFAGGPVVAFRLQSSQLSVREADIAGQERARAMRTLNFKPGSADRLRWMAWKIANIPGYCCRIIRYAAIAGKVRLPRTMELPGA
jgi:glycosyltransferase involved in cell wall biosynthesis